ncbi:DoxX family protein [Spirillospora sp. CA-255316]
MRSRPLYDIVALFARLGIGAVFMAHGWQKIEAGITATGRSFDQLGVPFPTGAAVYAAFVELLGGAALVAGLGLPVVGVLLFVDMAGAFVFVHSGEGLFVVDDGTARNGYELVLVLGLASLLFAAGAGGRLTADQWLPGGRSGRGRGIRRSERAREDEDDDGQSFVEALRGTGDESPPALEKPPPRPSSRSSSKSAPKSSSKSSSTTVPQAAARPEPPPPGGDARLATDIVSGTAGTEDDTLVAGRRKPQRRRRSSDTQPMKRDQSGGTGTS